MHFFFGGASDKPIGIASWSGSGMIGLGIKDNKSLSISPALNGPSLMLTVLISALLFKSWSFSRVFNDNADANLIFSFRSPQIE